MTSIRQITSLSAVTYTYNDGELAASLLRSMSAWTIQPMEVIVVDDGSTPPFKPPEDGPRVILLRNEHNVGPTRTKMRGLSAATQKFLLSLDCDTHLSPTWIEECLPLLHEPHVGMVSSPVRSLSGDDDLSRYIDARYSFTPPPGKISFIPGCAFLMRRDVFQSVGGFDGHDKRTNDDAFFCRRLQEHGFSLYIAPAAEAVQVRRLSVGASLKRSFEWDKPYFERHLAQGTSFGELFATFIMGIQLKVNNTPPQEFRLLYFDLLFLMYGSLQLAQMQNKLPQAHVMVWQTFHHIFQPYPCLREHLEKDLHRIFPQQACTPTREQNKFFTLIGRVFHEAFPEGGLVFLENFLRGDTVTTTPKAHFSHYETM